MSGNPVRSSSPARFYERPTLDLAEAIHAGELDRLRTLLSSGSYDISERGKQNTPLLLYAAAMENFEAVKALLESGANPNDAGDVGDGPMCLLSIAAGMENRTFFDILLEAGADPNGIAGMDPPIFIAIKAENWDLMHDLANHGADMNGLSMSGTTPLILLARTRCYQQAIELMERAADPWYVSPSGASLERTIRRFPLDPSTEKGKWQQKVIRYMNLKM